LRNDDFRYVEKDTLMPENYWVEQYWINFICNLYSYSLLVQRLVFANQQKNILKPVQNFFGANFWNLFVQWGDNSKIIFVIYNLLMHPYI
jgi:hypothetical protein